MKQGLAGGAREFQTIDPYSLEQYEMFISPTVRLRDARPWRTYEFQLDLARSKRPAAEGMDISHRSFRFHVLGGYPIPEVGAA
jgi:hypothetical protein